MVTMSARVATSSQGPSPDPGPAASAHEAASILVRLERAELAGAACTLGDLVRELRGAGAPPSGGEIVSLLDAYHRHLCSAYRGCAADGTAPVLAFSSFARAPRRDLSTGP